MPIVAMPDGTHVSFPDDMSGGQIRSIISQKFPDAAQRASAGQPTGADKAADVAGGVVKGVTQDFASGVLGLPGDMERGANYLFNKVLPSTNTVRGWFGAAPLSDQQIADSKAGLPANAFPSSSQVSDAIDAAGLGTPSPTTGAGQAAENVASFIPYSLMGPEGILANVLKRGVLPGAVSEAAGEATKGTAAEPYARMAGALVAPSGAKAAEAAAEAATPTSAELMADGGAGRNAFRGTPYATRKGVMQGWANKMLQDYSQGDRGFRPDLAPETTALLQETASNPGAYWTDDFDALHTKLTGIAQKGALNDQPAAAAAKQALVDRMTSLTPNQTLVGDPAQIADTWKTAQANWAAGERGKAIENALDNAQGAAAKKNSGMNTGNDIRNAIDPFTKNNNQLARESGFNQAEIDKMRQLTRGSLRSNALRFGSNLLGGGGGLGMGVVGGLASAAGAAADGAPGAALGPAAIAAGLLMRHGYNTMQLKRLRELSRDVRNRSPMGNAAPTMMSPNINRLLMLHQALMPTNNQ